MEKPRVETRSKCWVAAANVAGGADAPRRAEVGPEPGRGGVLSVESE